MPFLILLIFLFPLIIIFLPIIIEKRRTSIFIKNNPDHVKMQIFSGSSSSSYKIKIFSVNDQKPNFIGNILYLIPGKNKIIAQYKAIDENQKYNLMIGNLLGGIIGTIVNLISLIMMKKNLKMANPLNGITVDIETKRKGHYEMKADPYEDTINIICFESEKPDIKTYK
ncbi:MAG: hypothetical protein A2Y15_07110 [Clostridiales bacterium GWF2_36_10]|nr:MAG: hypothetical protein A2Y15_07110 [Clostridiales bacterium GWF2_36_10]HAN21345.1 hypothetical protein [Clostridiales bacterium]